MMNRKAIFIITGLCVILCGPAARAETVYLNNGMVMKGEITAERNDGITLKSENGETDIKQSEIKRILYGNSEMEKIFIVTNAGTTENGYMVDQDDSRIIIRENPSSPQEKAIPKKEIRQISRDETYPLDLELYLKPSFFKLFNSTAAYPGNAIFYSFGVSCNSMFGMDLRFMLESGYARFKNSSDSGRYLRIIPVTLGATYRFPFRYFNLLPKIGLGMAMMEFNTAEKKIYKSTGFQATAGAGIVREIVNRVNIGLWTDYTFLSDGSGSLHGATVSFTCGYRL